MIDFDKMADSFHEINMESDNSILAIYDHKMDGNKVVITSEYLARRIAQNEREIGILITLLSKVNDTLIWHDPDRFDEKDYALAKELSDTVKRYQTSDRNAE